MCEFLDGKWYTFYIYQLYFCWGLNMQTWSKFETFNVEHCSIASYTIIIVLTDFENAFCYYCCVLLSIGGLLLWGLFVPFNETLSAIQ